MGLLPTLRPVSCHISLPLTFFILALVDKVQILVCVWSLAGLARLLGYHRTWWKEECLCVIAADHRGAHAPKSQDQSQAGRTITCHWAQGPRGPD